MPNGVMIVMSQAVPGQEDAFNEWYDTVHLPEMLAVPGISAVQRFVAVPSAGGVLPPQRYLAVYELEGDVDQILENMRSESPGRTPPVGLDLSATTNYAYRSLGERITAPPTDPPG